MDVPLANCHFNDSAPAWYACKAPRNLIDAIFIGMVLGAVLEQNNLLEMLCWRISTSRVQLTSALVFTGAFKLDKFDR